MHIFIISIGFNLFWFAAVLGRQQCLPFLVIALLLLFLAKPKVVLPSLTIASIGILGDTLLTLGKILLFSSDFIPPWLCILWIGFASFIWLLRDFLLHKPSWALLLVGTAGGAMSYMAGAKLNAVNFHHTTFLTTVTLLTAWFCYSFLFIQVLKRYPQHDVIKQHYEREKKE